MPRGSDKLDSGGRTGPGPDYVQSGGDLLAWTGELNLTHGLRRRPHPDPDRGHRGGSEDPGEDEIHPEILKDLDSVTADRPLQGQVEDLSSPRPERGFTFTERGTGG